MKAIFCRKSSRRTSWASLALAMALAIVLFPGDALAYLDPGTGSFLIQGVIAVVVGAGFAIKMFWHRIKALLTGKPMEKDDETDD